MTLVAVTSFSWPGSSSVADGSLADRTVRWTRRPALAGVARRVTLTFHPRRLFLFTGNPLRSATGGSGINGATAKSVSTTAGTRWDQPGRRGGVLSITDAIIECLAFGACFEHASVIWSTPSNPFRRCRLSLRRACLANSITSIGFFLIAPRDWVSLTLFLCFLAGCGFRELRCSARFSVRLGEYILIRGVRVCTRDR